MLKEPVILNMNEMPYPPSPGVVKAAERGLLSLNRYADPADHEHLKTLMAGYARVPEEHVVLSPGSDLLLREIVLSFARERKIVMVSPSFLPTVQTAKQCASKLVRIRLSRPGFNLDPELLLGELEEPALVIIDNPNNPTGKLILDRRMVQSVLERDDTLLVVDEAYYEFSGVTFTDMVVDHPNLAVTRTMDKSFSLAGARIGCLVAGKRFLDVFSSFYEYLPQSSLQAAIEALTCPSDMLKRIRLITNERERVRKELESLGLRVCESSANFLLVQTRSPDAADRLKRIGILVSDVSSRLAPGTIRVSVGTPGENDVFLEGMRGILI